jgi:hypothetical protein
LSGFELCKVFPTKTETTGCRLKTRLSSKKSNIANSNFLFGRYLGHLEKEPSACVAMAGCPGVDKVEFTIISENVFDSPAYVWTKEGSVNKIEMEVSQVNKGQLI